MTRKFMGLCFLLSCAMNSFTQAPAHHFRVRTITAGITMNSLSDTTTFNYAVKFLLKARQAYVDEGYEVQTIRISTQNVYQYLGQHSYKSAVLFLVALDRIAQKHNISISIGQVLPPD